MPLPTPLHPRTSALCKSLAWKQWAGYHAVRYYDMCHEPEYMAVRHAAGLIDVSPLYKFDVRGPDAADFLAFVSARDATRLKVGRVGYGCWCDDAGHVLDDGTMTRFEDDVFRVTSADPSFGHLQRHAGPFDVEITDVSADLAAVALQGPRARSILSAACDGDVARLPYFGALRTTLAGMAVDVTRTGYTGDLGYEVWMAPDDACAVWDALMEAGAPHRMLPLGLDALDMLRIEAGFILLGVDYVSARAALIPDQLSTPYELGLGWTVKLDRAPFLGQAALRREKQRGSQWSLVGLDIDWDETEQLFDRHGLPPHLPAGAWREGVPVYDGPGRSARVVGRATSGSWSPLLKQNLALASVRNPHAERGGSLWIETTVEFARHKVRATVTKLPFLDLERKKS